MQGNRAPKVTAVIDDIVLEVGAENAEIDAAGHFGDDDGDVLRFFAVSADTEVATVSVTDTIVTVTPRRLGTARATIMASDGSLAVWQNVAVTVVPPSNRAPQAVGAMDSMSIVVNGPGRAVNVASNFSDPDDDRLSFSAASSDTDKAVAHILGSVVTVSPVNLGGAEIRVTASDADGLTASQSMRVQVVRANRAPQVVIPVADITLQIGGDSHAVNLERHIEDPDGDTLSYAIRTSDADVAAVAVTDSILTVAPLVVGDAVLAITADDGKLTTSTSLIVIVSPASPAQTNRAPQVASPIEDITLLAGGHKTETDITAHFNDPDGDALAYFAAAVDPHVAVASISGTKMAITPVSIGTTSVTVIASDGDLTATQEVPVTVVAGPNRPPVAAGTLEDISLTVGGNAAIMNVANSFNDPDGDTLSYFASSDNAKIATVTLSGTIVTVKPVAVGAATATIMANDGVLGASRKFSVTVAPAANRAPMRLGIIQPIAVTSRRRGRASERRRQFQRSRWRIVALFRRVIGYVDCGRRGAGHGSDNSAASSRRGASHRDRDGCRRAFRRSGHRCARCPLESSASRGAPDRRHHAPDRRRAPHA